MSCVKTTTLLHRLPVPLTRFNPLPLDELKDLLLGVTRNRVALRLDLKRLAAHLLRLEDLVNAGFVHGGAVVDGMLSVNTGEKNIIRCCPRK